VLRIQPLALVFGALAIALSGCATGPAGLSGHVAGNSQDANLIAQAANSFADQRLISMASKFRAAAPDAVTFAFDSASLDAEARRSLDIQAGWLKANPSVRMRVAGHTDKVGSEGYNSGLGLRRARAAVRYLVSAGVARTRLDAVESRGESAPVVQTEDRERRNRRTVTDVAGFERGFATGGMDGRRAVIAYRAYAADRSEAATTAPTGQ
jgi:outer membrane protein OmpA-like peptidoglycan-associated protein